MDIGTRVRIVAQPGENALVDVVMQAIDGETGVLVEPYEGAFEGYTTAVRLDNPEVDPFINEMRAADEAGGTNWAGVVHVRESEVEAVEENVNA